MRTSTTSIQMPGVVVDQNDTYLCASYKLDAQDTHYLVGFDPIATHHHGVHHVLLFGCEQPGSEDPVWNCGEMANGDDPHKSSPCTGQPDILYAWAHDAPKLDLPEGVAFQVGGNTRSQHLVLQVHYMHAVKEMAEDYSGVKVLSTIEPQPKTAATLLLVTGGSIPAESTTNLEVACVVDEDVQLHPFAFRVHTHRHGASVGGWVVREKEDGSDEWSLLGKRDPQEPQLFQPVGDKSVVVSQGDVLAARCVMKNEEKREIPIGPGSNDEMCNYYLMYWVEGDQTLSQNTCLSPGAPNYRWSREAGLNHIPS